MATSVPYWVTADYFLVLSVNFAATGGHPIFERTEARKKGQEL